ncbi:MAG: T9SS type A sorting domain-containing protein [Bacteroidales bacterium]|nr:T9SS type A sorting domain-containing protein [Bacteroidales bacterium]
MTKGDYQVYVVDSYGCKSGIDTITINEPKELTLSATPKNITCHGYKNGEVTLKAEGGSGKYSYSKDTIIWQDANTFTGLRDSTYKFYVKDKNGCRSNVSVIITQPASAVSGSILSQTNVSCYGGNNGSVTVLGSGGIGPYKYSLNGVDFQSSGTFNGLIAGTHTVTIRDANMCTSSVVVTITQPSAVSGSIVSQTNVTCHGGNNGSVTVSGSGGTPPYMYRINGGTYQSSGTFNGLIAGTHTVTIRDSNMCTSNVVVTITQPSTVSGSIVSQTNVSCHGGNNGSVTVLGSGGIGPYKYSLNGVDFQSSGTFNGLIAGTHTVTIRDANMCTSSVVVTITQPSAVTGSIVSQTNVSCYGGNNGSVTVSGSGGIGSYEYSLNGIDFQPSGTFSGLIACTDTVTICDKNGCTFDVEVTITQPSAVSGSILSQTNVSCYGGNNGSVTVSGSGGTPPYTFSKDGWSTTVGPTYNTYTFSGLSKGYYNLVGKDANGCTIALPQVNITSPSQLVLENIATTHNRCFSGSEGVISIKAAGGTAPYSYTVDNGLSWSADSVFSGLTAGNYYARVKDSLGCTINPTLVSITQPADSFVLAVDTFKNVSCFGGNDGEVSLYVALGGHPPFTYSSDGINWQPERVFNQLTAGVGYLYATDSSGCSVKVKNPVTQPEPISATVIPFNVDCKGASTGRIVLSIAGGVGSYQVTLLSNGKTIGSKEGIAKTAEYSDLPAGTYDLTIIDSNGCTKEINGIVIAEPANLLDLLPLTVNQPSCFGYSNGQVDADATGGWGGYRYTLLGAESNNGVFSGLKAGAYSIEVADSLGCKVQKWFTIGEPDSLTLDVKVSDVQCYGGSDGRAEITATGGTPHYSFAITGNEILPKGTNSELSVMENLTAGNYTIWLYDNHGCSTSKPITISQPPKLQVLQNNFNSGATDKTCTDTVLVAPVGGVAPYTIQFPDSTAIDCPTSGYLLHSLPNGRYPFRITDSHGCTVDDTASISNLPPPTLELVEVVNASCSYSADGSITVQAFSGTNWVEVKWNNGVTGSQLIGVPAGRYTAVATDLYGCTHAETYEISKPDTLIVSKAVVHNPTCYGGTDAGISVIVTGGTKPYSYLWSNGVQADSTGQVPAGVYSVTVTDSNGCTTSGSYTLTDPPSVQPSLPSLVTLCTNQTYIADAGVTGTSYLWLSNNGFTATTAKVELSASGEYYLIVTDGNGCVGRDTIRVESYNGIIDADFLIADRASVNDTIVLIEMSWPIPQAIQWLYPAESFNEIYRTDYSLFLIPLKEGLFTIGLMTYSGPCNQYIEKKITIGPSKEARNASSNLPLFKNTVAFPNPNNGQFELLVELNSQADIVVEIFTLYGKRILLKEFRGQSIYRIPSAINPIPGIYLVRITSGHHTESVRIVVQ